MDESINLIEEIIHVNDNIASIAKEKFKNASNSNEKIILINIIETARSLKSMGLIMKNDPTATLQVDVLLRLTFEKIAELNILAINSNADAINGYSERKKFDINHPNYNEHDYFKKAINLLKELKSNKNNLPNEQEILFSKDYEHLINEFKSEITDAKATGNYKLVAAIENTLMPELEKKLEESKKMESFIKKDLKYGWIEHIDSTKNFSANNIDTRKFYGYCAINGITNDELLKMHTLTNNSIHNNYSPMLFDDDIKLLDVINKENVIKKLSDSLLESASKLVGINQDKMKELPIKRNRGGIISTDVYVIADDIQDASINDTSSEKCVDIIIAEAARSLKAAAYIMDNERSSLLQINSLIRNSISQIATLKVLNKYPNLIEKYKIHFEIKQEESLNDMLANKQRQDVKNQLISKYKEKYREINEEKYVEDNVNKKNIDVFSNYGWAKDLSSNYARLEMRILEEADMYELYKEISPILNHSAHGTYSPFAEEKTKAYDNYRLTSAMISHLLLELSKVSKNFIDINDVLSNDIKLLQKDFSLYSDKLKSIKK